MLVLVLGSLSGTGCLIAEAPEYGAPRRTVPVIDSVTPLPSFFFSVKSGDPPKSFAMTVRSEDAGEAIIAAWVIDYGHPSRELRLGACRKVPARAADQSKPLTCDFAPDSRVTKGCHSLTLLVMHESSYDDVDRRPIPEISDGDVAAVTWFVNVETEGAGNAVPCPT